MITQNLVRLIETHSEELCQRWLDEVRTNEDTPTYHQYAKEKLLGAIRNSIAHLGEMLQRNNRDRVRETYTRLGKERYHQGFRANEVLKALILARRILWNFIEERGFYSALDMRQAMDLRFQILLFFDRAEFWLIKGFEQEVDLDQKVAAHAAHSHA